MHVTSYVGDVSQTICIHARVQKSGLKLTVQVEMVIVLEGTSGYCP